MKTIFLMILILGIAIFSFAQEREQKKQEIKTDSTILKPAEIGEFSVNKNDSQKYAIERKTHPFQKIPDDAPNQDQQNKFDFFANRQKPEFRMPVAGGGTDGFNMPVAVPDSTVEYYIKNKKIDYVNPREKSRK